MLGELTAGARADAEARQERFSFARLDQLAEQTRVPLDAQSALAPTDHVRVIAEIKRSSPSKGRLALIESAPSLATAYSEAGADAISVLTEERLRSAVDNSTGFVYAVSTMGITGARDDVDSAARRLVARLRSVGAQTVCVGLGIPTAEQVSDVCSYADGAIVGSFLVSALSRGGADEVSGAAKALTLGTTRLTA